MNTVQSVFDIAIRLMDAQHETTGATQTADTREYALRTPSLLNSILDRVYPASDTCLPLSGCPAGPGGNATGRRPICPKVFSLEDSLDLDERLCTGVLPYGLAGLLLAEEDPSRADFFWQTFLEQLLDARLSQPAADTTIVDCYGGVGGGQFGDW